MSHTFESKRAFAIDGAFHRLRDDSTEISASLDFTTREQWLALRAAWKHRYAALVAAIRATKAGIRTTRGDEQAALQSRRHQQRMAAFNLLLLRVAGKEKAKHQAKTSHAAQPAA